jgi:SAM-dependent methyltransferase
MFTKSAALYDALYSWKNYPAEVDRLHAIVGERMPDAKTLLDVACGTGVHMELLRRWYQVEGVDVEPDMLEVAATRLPGVALHVGDMRTFDLGRQFDVVACLFSSVGYMLTIEDLGEAIANMGRHLVRGGLMIVEPWLSPGQFDPNHLPRPLVASGDGFNVVRMNDSRVEGRLSIMNFHYLLGTPGELTHFEEIHRLALYTPDEYSSAFSAAGLTAEFDDEGLMGRGLWLARSRDG